MHLASKTISRIDRVIYIIVGLIVVLLFLLPYFGGGDQVILMIQILPFCIPFLILLGLIRWYMDPLRRLSFSESWLSLLALTIVLIVALYGMLIFGLKW